MEHTISTSADGSNTLQLTRFNETYHSRNGAYTEASHIYIACGLDYLFKNGLAADARQASPGINVYDIGLGTALNCILAWCWQQHLIRCGKPYPQIAYYGIEKYPIPPQEALQLNYPQVIAGHLENLTCEEACLCRYGIQPPHKTDCTPMGYHHPDAEEIASAFEKMHTCEWERNIEITPGFILHKNRADIKELPPEYFKGCEYENGPSAIFYDTFSPATQPELWDEKIFRAIAGGCSSRSILTTYCSKGTVKQALRNAGFKLERLAGPPGKRHILRASL